MSAQRELPPTEAVLRWWSNEEWSLVVEELPEHSVAFPADAAEVAAGTAAGIVAAVAVV